MGGLEESDDEQKNEIDETPGSLVWVRRRNGSWWPGRIMGLDELPESFSDSSRLGTPVKLLGREDGSMDWYNLGKSKRIRGFRCREHESCIEKARDYAIQSRSLGEKDRKYARREEAILQALEIEKAYFNERKNRHFSRRKPSKVNGGSKCKLSRAIVPLERLDDLNTVEVKVIQGERWSVQTAEGSKRKVNGISSTRLSQCCPSDRLFDLTRRKRRQCQLSKVLEDDSSSQSSIDGNFRSKSKENSKADDSSIVASSETLDTSDDSCEEILDGDDVDSFNDGLIDVPVVWKEIEARDFFSGYVSHRSSEESTTDESEETLDESDSSSFIDSPNHQITQTSEKEISKFGYEMADQTSNVSSDESPVSDNEGPHSQARSKQGWVFSGVHVTSSNKRKEETFDRLTACKRLKKSTFSRDLSLSFGTLLYDVQVDVDAIYWGPHSSLISLTSRFNGKVVVGQPIAVEVVGDLENCNVDFFRNHKRSRRTKNVRLTGDTSLIKSERMASENKKKGFLVRKTRRLSLLEMKGKPVVEKERRTVDCIPLALVFRRINEALICPSRRGNLR